MSDSEHSSVTYTSISSDDGSLGVGSPGVIVLGYDGLPMMPKDPYAYVEADVQEPPPPDFVLELVYPEFMPTEDDVLPAEEQPLPTITPTADSPEVDRLLAIPTPPLLPLTPLSSPLPRIPSPLFPVPSPVTSYSSPLPHIPSPPLPTSLTDAGAPLGYRAAMIPLRAESPSTSHPLPLFIVLLRTRASMVMMRAVAPSTYILAPRSGTPPLLPIPLHASPLPLLLPFTDYRADVPEVMLSPQKRLWISFGPRFEADECLSAPARHTRGFRADYSFVGTLDAEIRRDPDMEIDFVTTVRQDTNEIYGRLDDAQDDRLLMSGQLNLLRRDRRSHAHTARLIESEARGSREAWVQSMDASDMARSEVRALRTMVLA
nr:hypothetical protein [Tanacetum cinerariifolium]GFA30450.1 hypothetical protein [Tanacetum cinerariifolium]